MRIGAILFVALGALLVGACNGPGPDDEACTAQGGVCVDPTAQGACVEQLVSASGVCGNSTYLCCTITLDASKG
jgi:hypothetical protein